MTPDTVTHTELHLPLCLAAPAISPPDVVTVSPGGMVNALRLGKAEVAVWDRQITENRESADVRVVVPDHLELVVLAVSADMPTKPNAGGAGGNDGGNGGMAGWGAGAVQVQQAVGNTWYLTEGARYIIRVDVYDGEKKRRGRGKARRGEGVERGGAATLFFCVPSREKSQRERQRENGCTSLYHL